MAPKGRTAVAAMFYAHGLLVASWVSRIPSVKESVGLGDRRLGLVLLVLAFGNLLALPLSGWLIGRVGARRSTIASAFGACLALPLAGFAGTFATLAAALALLGGTLGTLDVAMNAEASQLEIAAGRSIMVSFHALWSLGALSGASLGGLLAACEIVPVWHFVAIAAMIAVGASIASRQLGAGDDHVARPGLTWPPRAALGFGLIATCGAVVENGVADWSGVLLRTTMRTSTGFAAAAFAVFALAMTIGRFSGDRLIDRFGPTTVLRAGALVSAAALAIALGAGRPLVAVMGFGVAGLGMSAVFPIAFSAAGADAAGGSPSLAIAAVATMGYGGGLLGPPLIGLGAEWLSLPLALGLLVILCLPIALLATIVRKSAGQAR